MRTTRDQLDSLVRVINRSLDTDTFEIEYAYGRPRLTRANRSVDVSPRLSTGELAQWLHAFIDGIDARRSVR